MNQNTMIRFILPFVRFKSY